MRWTMIAIIVTGCSGSNNVLLGRVERQVAGRTVIVTDCYRLRVPPTVAETSGVRTYLYSPCRDAVVRPQRDSLTVNGTPYGRVAIGDTVVVDHNIVRVTQTTPSSSGAALMRQKATQVDRRRNIAHFLTDRPARSLGYAPPARYRTATDLIPTEAPCSTS
jgi:hypothetical protein